MAFDYEIVGWSEEKIKEMNDLVVKKESKLPHKPNMKKIEKVVIEAQNMFYARVK